MKDIALLEFDENKALIEPSEQIKRVEGIPEKFVLTYFRDEVDRLDEDCKLDYLYTLHSEMGHHKVYKFMGTNIGLFALGVGAPLAAGLFEELIALGATKFLCCGGAGVLVDKELGCLIVPNEGVRDEGTSFHYLEPSRTVKMNRHQLLDLEQVLDDMKIEYIVGKTWTTDAFYRETRDKIKHRLCEGCITVEMEFTALLAVSKFRKVEFSSILYCGDDLSRDVWNGREWNKQTLLRKDLILLCKEAIEKL
jgi:uridine phosphorylase